MQRWWSQDKGNVSKKGGNSRDCSSHSSQSLRAGDRGESQGNPGHYCCVPQWTFLSLDRKQSDAWGLRPGRDESAEGIYLLQDAVS